MKVSELAAGRTIHTIRINAELINPLTPRIIPKAALSITTFKVVKKPYLFPEKHKGFDGAAFTMKDPEHAEPYEEFIAFINGHPRTDWENFDVSTMFPTRRAAQAWIDSRPNDVNADDEKVKKE